MSEQDIHSNAFRELRSIYGYHIDSYNALYHLKTENEEDLNTIYKMIKEKLIDSKKKRPRDIIRDILYIIPYNNRYAKSYLALAKRIFDDYQVKEVTHVEKISEFLFYKEYGIKLDESTDFEKIIKFGNLDIYSQNTIYRAIMYDDKGKFIFFTERDEFNEDQKLQSSLYPYIGEGYFLFLFGYLLLELCCYYGAVDCFKLLRTKFNSKITETCLELSFLGGNPEIMSECFKNLKTDEKCMEYAIISHNNDFVTFLMNEYSLEIDLLNCGIYKNLESFLVYFDQTNDINKCFIYTAIFDTPSLCEYFISHGANINEKDKNGQNALHIATENNSKETAEVLISHGANINEKDKNGQNALHIATENNSKETAELLISHCANINEEDNNGEAALHHAALCNSKEIVELLISHGININERNGYGKIALHYAAYNNHKEIAELLILNGAKINQKTLYGGQTALHIAAENNSKETAELLISHGANINEKDKHGKTAFHIAAENNSKETAEVLISHGANINEKDKNGKTPLHIAAENNSKETAELLISHGAKN